MKLRTSFSILLLAVLLLVAALAWPVAGQERSGVLCAQIGYVNCVESWNGADVSLYSDAGSTRTVNLDGANGDVTLAGTFNTDDNAVTISGATTVTPTDTLLLVAPAVVSTVTLATGAANVGDHLIIVNTVATSTVILDTGATVGGSNISLGLNDIAQFIYVNSKWVELASPDNS